MSEGTTLKQKIQGSIALEGLRELDEALRIKVAVARDCRVLTSRVLELGPRTKVKGLDFALDWESAGAQGVRLVVGPDVPDDRLLSADVHQQWVPAATFREEAAAQLTVAVPSYLLPRWRTICRTYTLRGRLVCRRWVWVPGQGLRLCDAPVRGAEVKAYDVDTFWWWYWREHVDTAVTDVNGYFEMTFTWCCLARLPWVVGDWRISPEILARIRELAERARVPIPLPAPSPDPDPAIFQEIVDGTLRLEAGPRSEARRSTSADGLERLGQRLVEVLPDAPDLRALQVWPFVHRGDCRPDIIFSATQECGGTEVVVYYEGLSSVRWNVATETDGIVLVANDEACCGPFCCVDPPEGDCLASLGAGCGGYPLENIEQDAADPLVGYGDPGGTDTPFGGRIPIRGVFGDTAGIDYYKPQRRRLSPAPTPWQDLAPDEIGNVYRQHWIGPPPPFHLQQSVRKEIAGQVVMETVKRFRDLNPQVVDTVDPSGDDRLFDWITGDANGPLAGLVDGVYELRFLGYRIDANDQLVDETVMPLCPAEGEDVDPGLVAGLKLRLDNRVAHSEAGKVHLTTTEPDCDFPDDCAVVINEDPGVPLALQADKCVDACGFARVSAGDTLTIHFSATDSDGHLAAFRLTAGWGESNVFDVLAAGTLAPDPHVAGASPLVGPSYGATFAGAQGAHRAALPAADPEHARPFWYGGQYAVTVPVGALVPGGHRAFETCCAYQLDLEVWKRTTDGCASPRHFHANRCQLSFTVIREDLIGHPDHPSCTALCPEP